MTATRPRDLLGVFNRSDVGAIDLIWRDDKGGLKHFIDKHINDKDFKTIEKMIYSIEDVINNGTIDFKDGDKIVIKKGGYVVTIRKNFRRNGKKIADKNWILTAYNKDTPINTLAPAAKIKGGTAVTTSVSSARKGTTSSAADQTNGEKKTDFPYPITKTIQPRKRSWIENYLADKD